MVRHTMDRLSAANKLSPAAVTSVAVGSEPREAATFASCTGEEYKKGKHREPRGDISETDLWNAQQHALLHRAVNEEQRLQLHRAAAWKPCSVGLCTSQGRKERGASLLDELLQLA